MWPLRKNPFPILKTMLEGRMGKCEGGEERWEKLDDSPIQLIIVTSLIYKIFYKINIFYNDVHNLYYFD